MACQHLAIFSTVKWLKSIQIKMNIRLETASVKPSTVRNSKSENDKVLPILYA